MKHIKLTTQERQELKDLHKKGLAASEADKIKAILMLDDGYTAKETARVLLLNENTITDWKNRFLNREYIDNWIKAGKKGYWGKLNENEKLILKEFVDAELIANCEKITKFIEDNFGKTYSQSGCQQLLHSLGYVYKYTTHVPSKMDIKKQEQFKRFYDKLSKKQLKTQVLLFGDSVHPEHNTSPTKVWIKKGEEKVIKSNTGRDRINISGLYDVKNVDFTYTETKTVNSATFIELLSKVEEKYKGKRKIRIILDNSSTHKSAEVKEYLKKHKKIELIFIPPYSPNLNLIERLWKYLRKKCINSVYYEKFKDFRESICNFLDNLQEHAEEVRKFIGTELRLMPAFAS